jgi:dCTP diphosphatase
MIGMELEKVEKKVIEFRDARDWAQYHNTKDLAISLSLEAAELLEIFRRENSGEVEADKSEPENHRNVQEEHIPNLS